MTTTAPFDLTHARRTWTGVALSLLAALRTGSSTGPPGYRVIGLAGWSKPGLAGTQRPQTRSYLREGAVSFDDDPALFAKVDHGLLFS